ncbi:hypothetical protein ACOSP7_032068 [Xanthoceras sorbifolium]
MGGRFNKLIVIGALQYLTYTRPDISFASNNLQLENTSQASTSVTNVNRSVQHTTLLAMVKAPSKFQDAQQSNKTLDWR